MNKNIIFHVKRNGVGIYIYFTLFCFSLFDNVTEFRNKPEKKETEMPNDTKNNELCQEHSSLYENRE